jgi:glycosyltransferase involved in cell wall biosynthesis
MELHKVSVVIPAKNEAANISWVLHHIPPMVHEIVLVDGHSTDSTIEVATRLRPDIVVVHEERRGKGAALQAGFAAASGDIVVMLDADGSMHPGEIIRYIAMLVSGFDFVKGSRFMAGGGSSDITRVRRLGNRGLLGLANFIYRTRYTDLCYGYCAFRRTALNELALSADGFEIETQLVLHASMAGLRISEVPSFESPRRFGQSNLRTFRDGQRVLWTLLRARSAFPRLSYRHQQSRIIDLASRGALDGDPAQGGGT